MPPPTDSALTLVVLAAGIGRRFGGDKQLAAVGPRGETLLDYTVFDARRAGIRRVVFVIRPELEADFRAAVITRFARHVDVSFAYQRLADVPAGFPAPAGRSRPWGTGQAVLAAAEQIAGPFVVTNADDFYGAAALSALAEFLRATAGTAPGDVPIQALVGYALRDTLPASGAVSRAVCRATPEGWLTDITELIGVRRAGEGAEYPGADGALRALPGDTPVSMNAWGFQHAFLAELRRGFSEFLAGAGDDLAREYYLPSAVQAALHAGRTRVRLLPASSAWCGLTNPEDRAVAVRMLAELTAQGRYPEPLWQ